MEYEVEKSMNIRVSASGPWNGLDQVEISVGHSDC